MAAKQRAKQTLDQLRHQIEQLRKDSFTVVTNANRIVYNGVQKLADRELQALNDYYHAAITSIRNADRGDLRGLAHTQLDLLQETVNQVIGHARESMSIVADTRAELTKLVQKGMKGEKVPASKLSKAAAPARKAVGKVKAAAKKASKDAGKSVRKAGTHAKAATRKAASSGKRSATAAMKAVESVLPSPDSRAARATSRAKHTATSVMDKVTHAVSGAVNAVTDAVKNQG
ncbi:MAG: phasin family protein [Nevskia sp.]|nr:phasin family protein [Nevskia sp.]